MISGRLVPVCNACLYSFDERLWRAAILLRAVDIVVRLVDPDQEAAQAYGAVCTPDFFGYNARLELQYRGRLDESGRHTDAGEVRRDLFLAMKQVSETGRGPREQVASIGCSIKWRDNPS